MAAERRRVLVVDDEEDIRTTMRAVLRRAGYTVTAVSNGDAALQAVREHGYPAVICDLRMPGMSGDELIAKLRAEHPQVSVVVLTGHGTVDHAVGMMLQGVADYLTKPVKPEELLVRLDRVFQTQELLVENERLRAELGRRAILGESQQIRHLLELIAKVAPTDATVLITGESGVGKELVVHAIHARSHRRDAPLVMMSCAAVPETLLEAELFGAEEGAYTDARKQRIGRFEQAHGGTLFLDEIGDISAAMQVKLLRVLQERQFERVGGNETIQVDVRLISATNQDLRDSDRDPPFREDLYFSLMVIIIQVPRLRERGGDIAILADAFVQRFAREMNRPICGITPAGLSALQTYRWPGNVRELENAIERAVVLADGDELDAADFDFLEPRGGPEPSDDGGSLEALERAHIREVLESCDGNRTRAAERLGIHRETLANKIRRYRLE